MMGETMRPAGSIQTLARAAKALVSGRNPASARNGLRSGTVTSQKRRHGLFDSKTAHSNSSGGTALMPARSSTPMNELPRQMKQDDADKSPGSGAEGAVDRVFQMSHER